MCLFFYLSKTTISIKRYYFCFMNIYKRPLENGDAEMANEWLKSWGLNPLPLTMYPDTGVVFENDDSEIFVGFIWTSNSCMAQIGFITRNPNVKNIPKGTRKEFVRELIITCRDMGYKHISTWTDNKFLIKDMKELGMTETSNKCSELIIYKLK